MLTLIIAFLLIKDLSYKTVPIVIPIELLPLYGRIYYIVTFFAWSSLIVLYQTFVLKEDLLSYTLMAVFAVNDGVKSKIKPEDLGLLFS